VHPSQHQATGLGKTGAKKKIQRKAARSAVRKQRGVGQSVNGGVKGKKKRTRIETWKIQKKKSKNKKKKNNRGGKSVTNDSEKITALM